MFGFTCRLVKRRCEFIRFKHRLFNHQIGKHGIDTQQSEWQDET